MDPKSFATNRDSQAVASHLAATAKVQEGAELAGQGDIEGAIAAFKEAQKLDPGVDLDPATPDIIDKDPQVVAPHVAATAKVKEGAELAGQGDIEGAIAAFKEAQKLDRKVDLDPNTPAIDKDPQVVARTWRHLRKSQKEQNWLGEVTLREQLLLSRKLRNSTQKWIWIRTLQRSIRILK